MVNFYLEASLVLQQLFDKKSTIKKLVMHQTKLDKKQLYAAVCQSLKYRKVLVY
jgi:hypothetical protein